MAHENIGGYWRSMACRSMMKAAGAISFRRAA